jgi:hypothetical protein
LNKNSYIKNFTLNNLKEEKKKREKDTFILLAQLKLIQHGSLVAFAGMS